jgi:hypothetical protein
MAKSFDVENDLITFLRDTAANGILDNLTAGESLKVVNHMTGEVMLETKIKSGNQELKKKLQEKLQENNRPQHLYDSGPCGALLPCNHTGLLFRARDGREKEDYLWCPQCRGETLWRHLCQRSTHPREVTQVIVPGCLDCQTQAYVRVFQVPHGAVPATFEAWKKEYLRTGADFARERMIALYRPPPPEYVPAPGEIRGEASKVELFPHILLVIISLFLTGVVLSAAQAGAWFYLLLILTGFLARKWAMAQYHKKQQDSYDRARARLVCRHDREWDQEERENAGGETGIW